MAKRSKKKSKRGKKGKKRKKGKKKKRKKKPLAFSGKNISTEKEGCRDEFSVLIELFFVEKYPYF